MICESASMPFVIYILKYIYYIYIYIYIVGESDCQPHLVMSTNPRAYESSSHLRFDVIFIWSNYGRNLRWHGAVDNILYKRTVCESPPVRVVVCIPSYLPVCSTVKVQYPPKNTRLPFPNEKGQNETPFYIH